MHATHLLVGYNLYNPLTFYLALSICKKRDCSARLKKTSIILLVRLLLVQVPLKISEASSFLINVDKCSRTLFDARETSEGGPWWLLELMRMVTQKNTNERAPALVGSLGLSCRYKFIFCLDWSSRPSRKYVFPHCALFQFFVPIAQQAGQTAVLGRLSLSVCLCWYIGGFAHENWPLSRAKLAGGWLPGVHLFSTVWQSVSGKLFQSDNHSK